MTWLFTLFHGACIHIVHRDAFGHVMHDLVERGATFASSEPVTTEGFIDRPGVIFGGRPVSEFVVDGLRLGVPDEDVAWLIRTLEELPPRSIGGMPIRKVHTWTGTAFCFTDVQRDALLKLLRNALPRCEESARRFYLDKTNTDDVLRDIAAKQNGIPLEEVPSLSHPDHGRRHDRFLADHGELAPRTRGQA